MITTSEFSRGIGERPRGLAQFPLLIWPSAALLATIILVLSPGGSLLRMAATWLILYLLPGLVLCSLLDPLTDLFEQIVFGMAVSPAVVSVVLYLTAGLMGLPLIWSLVISGLVFAGLTIFAFLRRDSIAVPRPTVPGTMVFAAAGVFAGLVVWYYLKWPGTLIGPHGLFHTAIIHQVMNGIIPPHNIHLYGAPTAYQWPCYLLPAVSSLLSGSSPPVTAAMLRVTTFLGIFGMGYLIARQLGRGAAGRALSGVFSVLGMNLFGGVHYLARSLAVPELRFALFHGENHPQLSTLFAPGLLPVHIQVRTSTLILKLLNFSYILPGFASVMVVLLGFILVLQGRGRKGYPLVVVGALGALLIHPLMAAVIAVPLPLALFLVRLINRGDQPEYSWKRIFAITGCLAVAGLAALPYLVPEMKSSGGDDISTGVSYEILLTLLWTYVPLALIAAIRFPRTRRPVPGTEKLLILFTLLIAASITIHQLKCWWYMLYLVTIPLGLLAGEAAGRWYDWISQRWLQWGLCLLLILLAFSGPLLQLHHATLAHQDYDGDYQVFGGPMIRLSDEESDLAGAYAWIREHTDLKDVLVEWPRGHSREELAALTGRRVYVGKPGRHAPPADDPRMSEALAVAEELLDPELPDKSHALQHLAAIPGTVYLILTRESVEWKFPSLVRIYDEYPHRLELCLDLPEAKIYRVTR